jgi:hypothetical protein
MHTVKEWKHPDSYIGTTWEGWFSSGFGRSRDSSVLEESNFQVASKTLLALATDNDDESTVQIVREGHWAVGWVEWIAIHGSNAAALAKARELCAKVEDYPALDEDHWSNLEYERAMDYWESMSLASKVDFCRDCGVSIFAARRSYDMPDRLYEALAY